MDSVEVFAIFSRFCALFYILVRGTYSGWSFLLEVRTVLEEEGRNTSVVPVKSKAVPEISGTALDFTGCIGRNNYRVFAGAGCGVASAASRRRASVRAASVLSRKSEA